MGKINRNNIDLHEDAGYEKFKTKGHVKREETAKDVLRKQRKDRKRTRYSAWDRLED